MIRRALARLTVPRLTRPIVLAVSAAALVAVTVAAVLIASFARTPAQRAAQAAPPSPSLVTAEVTLGALVDETVLPGALTRASTVSVPAPKAVQGASALVVTHTPVKAGTRVRAGALVAEVSGRPVLLLRGSFAAYRDLTYGDSGRDVRQLQQGLQALYGTGVTGTFDKQTEQAVTWLYGAVGYKPLTGTGAASGGPGTAPTPAPTGSRTPPPAHVVIPAGEIAYVPTLPATVGEVRLRTGKEASGALLTLTSGAWRAVAQLDAQSEDALLNLPEGGKIRLGEGPLEGRTARLIEVREADGPPDGQNGGGDPVREAVFEVKGSVRAQVGASQDVVVEAARSPDDSLIVPVSALWTGGDGVVRIGVVRGGRAVQVTVEVLVGVEGRAAVRVVDGSLAAGDEVVVSYEGGTGKDGVGG